MKFDGIILDVDGTIWNTTEIVARAWNRAIDEGFPQVPHVTADILKGQFGKTMDVIGNNLFSALGPADRSLLLDKCCQYEQKTIEKNQKDIAYRGVVATIKKLAEKFPLFIVSNCQSGYIELVMRKNRIESCIKDFTCFGDNGNAKDKNISLIVKRNSLQKPVYVGDTQGDFEACQKARVPFIWAAYGFGKPETENYFAKIESFSEIEELIME